MGIGDHKSYGEETPGPSMYIYVYYTHVRAW